MRYQRLRRYTAKWSGWAFHRGNPDRAFSESPTFRTKVVRSIYTSALVRSQPSNAAISTHTSANASGPCPLLCIKQKVAGPPKRLVCSRHELIESEPPGWPR